MALQLAIGITADPNQAKAGVSAAQQSLQQLDRTIKNVQRDAAAANQNFKQFGQTGQGSGAVVNSALRSVQRNVGRLQSDMVRLSLATRGTGTQGAAAGAQMTGAYATVQRSVEAVTVRLRAMGAAAVAAGRNAAAAASQVAGASGVGMLGRGAGIGMAGRSAGPAGVVAGLLLADVGIARQADRLNELRGRLRLVTDGSEDLDRVWNRLRQTSMANSAAFDASVDLYFRLARAQDQTKLSGEGLFQVMDTVQKTVRTSGASTQAAEAALYQFAQGMQSGRLAGEELRSVIEQLPALASAIADGMGVQVGALRDMASAGELTAEKVSAAILRSKDVVAKEFADLPKLVGQAATDTGTAWGGFIEELDKTTGSSNRVITSLETVTGWLEALRRKLQQIRDGGGIAGALGEIPVVGGLLSSLFPERTPEYRLRSLVNRGIPEAAAREMLGADQPGTPGSGPKGDFQGNLSDYLGAGRAPAGQYPVTLHNIAPMDKRTFNVPSESGGTASINVFGPHRGVAAVRKSIDAERQEHQQAADRAAAQRAAALNQATAGIRDLRSSMAGTSLETVLALARTSDRVGDAVTSIGTSNSLLTSIREVLQTSGSRKITTTTLTAPGTTHVVARGNMFGWWDGTKRSSGVLAGGDDRANGSEGDGPVQGGGASTSAIVDILREQLGEQKGIRAVLEARAAGGSRSSSDPLRLPGFQHGGAFTVGGGGGIDRTLVQFMATRGERVEVTPAGQGASARGGGTTVVNNHYNIPVDQRATIVNTQLMAWQQQRAANAAARAHSMRG